MATTSSGRTITTLNLFDEVFATIPDDVFLDFGPATLMEARALGEEAQTVWEGRTEVDPQEPQTSSPTSPEAPPSILAAKSTSLLRSSWKGKQMVEKRGDKKDSEVSVPAASSPLALTVHLHEEDEAVRKAMEFGEAHAIKTNEKSENPIPPAASSPSVPPSFPRSDILLRSEVSVDRREGASHPKITCEDQVRLMPPGLPIMYEGTCATMQLMKGFGFITPDLGGPDIYFIRDSVMLSFTRLVLACFYAKQEKPLPQGLLESLPAPVVAPAVEEGDAQENVETAPTTENEKGICTPTTDSHPTATNEETVEANETTSSVLDHLQPILAQWRAEDPRDGFRGEALGVSTCATPPTTVEELEAAWSVASKLSESNAALLQWQVDVGKPTVHHHHRLSFTVHRNKVAQRIQRMLRAEHVRGVKSAFFATGEEQAWFCDFFPQAVGYKDYVHPAKLPSELLVEMGRPVGVTGDASPSSVAPSLAKNEEEAKAPHPTLNENKTDSAEDESLASSTALPTRMLERYSGYVRMYNPETRKGYIACDAVETQWLSLSSASSTTESSGTGVTRPQYGHNALQSNNHPPDVMFFSGSVLFMPDAKQSIVERLRVHYSVCDRGPQKKFVATLITGVDDVPFSQENYWLAEVDLSQHRAAHRQEGGGARWRGGRAMDHEEGSEAAGLAAGPLASDGTIKSSAMALQEIFVGGVEENDVEVGRREDATLAGLAGRRPQRKRTRLHAGLEESYAGNSMVDGSSMPADEHLEHPTGNALSHSMNKPAGNTSDNVGKSRNANYEDEDLLLFMDDYDYGAM